MQREGEYWTGAIPATSINASSAHRAFDHGFSVVLNRLNYRDANVFRLCQQFARDWFGVRTNANLYLTPNGAQAFEAHFDFMESFVLQVEGQKRWRLYENRPIFELPLAIHKFKPSAQDIGACGSPQEVLLQAGDLMYIPSGFVHEAWTESDGAYAHAHTHTHIHTHTQTQTHTDTDTQTQAGADTRHTLLWESRSMPCSQWRVGCTPGWMS